MLIQIQRPYDPVRGYYYNGPCGFVTDIYVYV